LEEVYEEIKTGLRWEYSSKLITIVLNLLVTVLLSRILLPSDYGVMGIVMTVNGLAGVFSSFGFSSAIIQTKKLDENILASIFNLNVFISLLIYSVLFVLSPYVAEFYKIENLVLLIRVSAIGFVLSALGTVHSALLIREMNFKKIAEINLKSSIYSGFVGLFACYFLGIWGLVVQQLLSIVIYNLFYWNSVVWFPKIVFRFSEIRTQLNFGIYMFLSSLLDSVFSRIDLLYIGKVFSATSLGLYSRSTSFDGLIRNLTSTSILSVLFPAFSKNKYNLILIRTLFKEYFVLICFVFSLISGIFYLTGENLFVFLFGHSWILAGAYYKIIGIAGFCFPLSSLCISVLESQGKSNLYFYSEVLKKILVIPFYLAIYGHDISFLLIGMTLYTILSLFITMYTAANLIKISFYWCFNSILKYMFLSFSLLFVVLKLRDFISYPDNLISNFFEVVFYGLCYIQFSRVLKFMGYIQTWKLLFGK
jgi:teichuronic acid exporter